MDERKKFRLADVILSVICVVFVAEAAAPVASIGNSQYFWWLFMMVAFLLPYGMISSELGTTYPGDGGLYDWIHKAFPETKWGARASWYYWINFPLWMASLAVVCPELLGVLTGLRFGWGARLLIELAFIWIVTWIACYPVCDSILILNISAAIKMLLALTVGVLGIVYVARSGFVNDMAPRTFLPGFDLHSLSYISVIIFNFLGFEVVCTYADNMRDPKRQIPQAIVSGGIVIALIYLFSAFGIGAAIPTQEISEDSGLIDAVSLMTGRTSGWFVGAVALLFLITLFGNMISWSMGVNATAAYAADRGDMPAVFARRWKRNDMPVGSAVTSGIKEIRQVMEQAESDRHFGIRTIVFVDEIHRMNRAVEEILYPAMEDFAIDIIIGKGPSANSIRLDLPHFTLIGATTRAGQLSAPLRDRFGVTLRLELYTPEELSQIVTRSAGILGIPCEAEGAMELARRSRGTPRIANRFLKRVRDFAQVQGSGVITPEIAAECMEKIFLPTIHAMNAEGCPFKGCLYFGLMLTPDGPKVIEYNCRFGDPETQVVLPLLEGDLLHIMEACTNGTLADEDVKFSDGAAACVILASGGYPVAYEKGKPISGLVDGQLPDEENVTVYHSGTALTEDGQLVTNGGRVLGVTATGPRLTNALSHAYEAAEKIHFDKLHKRSDIGLRALKALAEKQ